MMVPNSVILTVPWLDEQGVLTTLGDIYDHREKALGPLMAIGYESHLIPVLGELVPYDWWRSVCVRVLADRGPDAMIALLSHVADRNPGHAVFRNALTQLQVKPSPISTERVSVVAITIRGETSDAQALSKIAQIQMLAQSLGLPMQFELSSRGSIQARFSFRTAEEAQRFVEEAASRYPDLSPELTDINHHDYWMDPLYAEGPDGSHYQLDHVPASSRVGDVAQSVTQMFQDTFWPRGKAPVKAVVDLAGAEGTGRRLNPDDTLHEAGVRPHNTLRVHPEAQAGAVDPFLRYESLALVRNQIRDFARANPGFRVQANSAEVATEYLFRFDAPSFAPGEPPVPIDHHEVLLILGPDFPMEGPLAFWQHPIFHPNVAADSGVVCLGVLRESYRPGLHFGEVCQMLIDMAAFRNYVVHEGFNAEAAQWAVSPEGQAAIVARGGRSLLELYGTEVNRPIRFTVRRLDG